MAKKIQVQGEALKSGAFIAERHRLTDAALNAKPAASYTFAGICSILALIVFAAMVVILWLDWTALKMA